MGIKKSKTKPKTKSFFKKTISKLKTFSQKTTPKLKTFSQNTISKLKIISQKTTPKLKTFLQKTRNPKYVFILVWFLVLLIISATIGGLVFKKIDQNNNPQRIKEINESIVKTNHFKNTLKNFFKTAFSKQKFSLTEDQKQTIFKNLKADKNFRYAQGPPGKLGKQEPQDKTQPQKSISQSELLKIIQSPLFKIGVNNLISRDILITSIRKAIKSKTISHWWLTPEDFETGIWKIINKKLNQKIFNKITETFKTKKIKKAENLSNTDTNKNSFYKLAPFLFKTPKEANEKLNELLTGNLVKKDDFAIWKETDAGSWNLRKLNDLKNNKKTYQKVIYQQGEWKVANGNENIYTPN